MARNRNGNYTFSGKPCDIEYRLKRATELLQRLEACLRSIDPEALQGDLPSLIDRVPTLTRDLNALWNGAPNKRTHVRRSPEERAAAKADAAKRAAERAEKRAAKAAQPKGRKAKADAGDLVSLDAVLSFVEGVEDAQQAEAAE